MGFRRALTANRDPSPPGCVGTPPPPVGHPKGPRGQKPLGGVKKSPCGVKKSFWGGKQILSRGQKILLGDIKIPLVVPDPPFCGSGGFKLPLGTPKFPHKGSGGSKFPLRDVRPLWRWVWGLWGFPCAHLSPNSPPQAPVRDQGGGIWDPTSPLKGPGKRTEIQNPFFK